MKSAGDGAQTPSLVCGPESTSGSGCRPSRHGWTSRAGQGRCWVNNSAKRKDEASQNVKDRTANSRSTVGAALELAHPINLPIVRDEAGANARPIGFPDT